jgi:hypothetical protein
MGMNCAGFTGALAVRVDVLGHVDVNRLRALSADRGGRLRVLIPLRSDHDETVGIAQLRVNRISTLVLDHHLDLEAKRLLKPGKGGARILVGKRRNYRGAGCRS